MATELPDIPDEPLEYQWAPKAMMQIPSEMVVAMAQGLETEQEIAQRFGFTGESLAKLLAYPPFKTAVAQKKLELEKSGWVFRQKAAMQAEMLLDQVFVSAMNNDVGLMQKLEALKYLTKVGNLEPKEEKQANAGPGFSISINLGANSVQLGSQTPEIIEIPTQNSPKKAQFDVLEIPLDDPEID